MNLRSVQVKLWPIEQKRDCTFDDRNRPGKATRCLVVPLIHPQVSFTALESQTGYQKWDQKPNQGYSIHHDEALEGIGK